MIGSEANQYQGINCVFNMKVCILLIFVHCVCYALDSDGVDYIDQCSCVLVVVQL